MTEISGSEHTDDCNKAIRIFWTSFEALCQWLQHYDQAVLEGSASYSPAEMAEAEAEAGRNEALSMALASHTVSLLSLTIVYEGGQADALLTLLTALMMRSSKRLYQATATAIVKAGEQ